MAAQQQSKKTGSGQTKDKDAAAKNNAVRSVLTGNCCPLVLLCNSHRHRCCHCSTIGYKCNINGTDENAIYPTYCSTFGYIVCCKASTYIHNWFISLK